MKSVWLCLVFLLYSINALSKGSDNLDVSYLRTPEARFDILSDYPFKPNYVFLNYGFRMHYLDEGKQDDIKAEQPVFLLLHGEPSWSYIYRNIIPKLVSEGYRVIVPDLIGFGKSDKPKSKTLHTYSNHTEWLTQFVQKLKLKSINLYAHDWGGMLGLRIVAQYPEVFATVAISNGFLFTGEETFPKSFLEWQNFSQTDKNFDPGIITNWGSSRVLSDSEMAAYSAPFPDESYKAGIRRLPMMIPESTSDPEAIINKALMQKLKQFNKPFLTLWSDHKDAMWDDKDLILQRQIPGAKEINHLRLDGGHFIQEDQSEMIVEQLIKLIR